MAASESVGEPVLGSGHRQRAVLVMVVTGDGVETAGAARAGEGDVAAFIDDHREEFRVEPICER